MQRHQPEPFDVNTITDAPSIEAEISALVPGGSRNIPTPSIRRKLDSALRSGIEPTSADPQQMEEQARSPDAGEAIIRERQVTHGTFEDNARVSQTLKLLLRAEPGWLKLTDVERECMDMIALKFSRMLSGRSLEKQHWEDVVGYAKLALNQAEGKPCNG